MSYADPAGPIFDRVGIVVPAKNEEQLLPACLRSLVRAARRCPVPTDIVVVLDSCTDGSAEVVAKVGRSSSRRGLAIHSLQVAADSVGRARAAGMSALLGAAARDEQVWLATTDADSTVPPYWLQAQLAHARDGASAVVGTVRVDDWSERPPEVVLRAERDYVASGHRHIHGANLAFTAAAYQRAGGFPSVESDEDVGLVRRLEATERIVWATDLPVTTSARRFGRAPAGFAGYLDMLARGGGRHTG
jgi:glycosyltransferase involved in cell wall biosynthesis